MTQKRLRNKFLEETEELKELYNTKRNLCVFLPKIKKGYFSRLDDMIFNDNRKFWKSVSPLFSEKVFDKEHINLLMCEKKQARRDM